MLSLHSTIQNRVFIRLIFVITTLRSAKKGKRDLRVLKNEQMEADPRLQDWTELMEIVTALRTLSLQPYDW